MSEVQTVSAVVHEIAHSKLHNDKRIEEPKDAPKYQEIEILMCPACFLTGVFPLLIFPKECIAMICGVLTMTQVCL